MFNTDLEKVIKLKHFLDDNIQESLFNDYRDFPIAQRTEKLTTKSINESIFKHSIDKDKTLGPSISFDDEDHKFFKEILITFGKLFKDNEKYLNKVISFNLSLPPIEFKYYSSSLIKKRQLCDTDVAVLNSYHDLKFENITSIDKDAMLELVYTMIKNKSTKDKCELIEDYLMLFPYTCHDRRNDMILYNLFNYVECFLNRKKDHKYFVISKLFQHSTRAELPYMSLVDKDNYNIFLVIQFVGCVAWGEGNYDYCKIKELISSDALLQQYVKKTIIEMITYKTNLGIITDGFCFFFIEIPFESLEDGFAFQNIETDNGNLDSYKDIPLKITVRDLSSLYPTIKESLIYFFMYAIENDVVKKDKVGFFDKLAVYLKKKQKKRMLEYQNELFLSKKTKTIDPMVYKNRLIYVAKNDLEIIQYGKCYNSQIFKIDALYVAENLHDLPNQQHKVVVKCYNALEDDHLAEDYCDFADNESYVYEILLKEPGFNSIYIKLDRLFMDIWCDGEFYSKSRANIFKYIDAVPLKPFEIKQYSKDIVSQFKLIHKNGILHSDILLSNILISKSGDVYIIGFTKAISNSKEFEVGAAFEMYQLEQLLKI